MKYIAVTSDSFLVHHGILGQKWGKRNGPPYPLDASDHSASEKKAGWRKSLAGNASPTRTLNKTYDEKQILTAKGRDGKELTLEQVDRSIIAKGLGKISKKIYEDQMNDKFFDIKVDGKHIGDLEITQVSPTEINGVWLGVNDKYRGNGYATACLMTALHECKEQGYKTFTLEVPGNSPDARHIYEKLGFIPGEQLTEDDVWGGLTAMELDLTKYEW